MLADGGMLGHASLFRGSNAGFFKERKKIARSVK